MAEAEGYEWEDEDGAEDEPAGSDDQDKADKDGADLATRVQAIENANKAKADLAAADAIREKFLASLPEEHRALAAVGIAGAESPTIMREQIKKVQSLLPKKEVAAPADADGESDEDEPDAFAPVETGTPVAVQRPEEKRERALKERIAFGAPDANKAALALYLKDSPVFGDVVKDW